MVIGKIAPIPNIIGGVLVAFLALLGLRITYPMADAVLNLWGSNTQMKIAATLVMYLVYVFILWVFVWAKFFKPEPVVGVDV